jgi:hypothetical protein
LTKDGEKAFSGWSVLKARPARQTAPEKLFSQAMNGRSCLEGEDHERECKDRTGPERRATARDHWRLSVLRGRSEKG